MLAGVRSAVRARPSAAATLASSIAVVGTGVWRLAHDGRAPVGLDPTRYLEVGLSVLAGRGAVTASGELFTARSPVVGVLLALASKVAGGPVFDGPVYLVWAFGLLGLVLAVALAARLRGGGAAVAAAGALIATPLIWETMRAGLMHIDLIQAAGIVATLLLLLRPTTTRWVAAGVVLGFTILVKEPAVVLVVLPLAFLGTVPRREWLRLSAWFVGAVAVSAGWWWVYVAASGHGLASQANVESITRDVPNRPFPFDPSGRVAIAVFLVAWLVTAYRGRKDPRVRALVVAALGLLPGAAFTLANDLARRNFFALAVLCCIAFGFATAVLVEDLVARLRAAGRDPAEQRQFVAMGLVVVVVAGIALTGILHSRTTHLEIDNSADVVRDQAVAYLEPRLGSGDRVLASGVDTSYLNASFSDRDESPVQSYFSRRLAEPVDLRSLAWLGSSYTGDPLGIERDDAVRALVTKGAKFLLEPAGATAFDPIELIQGLPVLLDGIDEEHEFRDGPSSTRVYSLDRRALRDATVENLLTSPSGVTSWWRRTTAVVGVDEARRQLLEAQPIVIGNEVGLSLLEVVLGDVVCYEDVEVGDHDAVRLVSCDDPTTG